MSRPAGTQAAAKAVAAQTADGVVRVAKEEAEVVAEEAAAALATAAATAQAGAAALVVRA